MKFAFYFFIISQILNSLDVFAEKIVKDSSEINSIKWEKVQEKKDKPLKNIIWKSYSNDKSFFENKSTENKSKNNNKILEEPPTWRKRTLRFSFEEIDMPDPGELMGLYSIGAYDHINSWLYGGITLYGAASGRRGGFCHTKHAPVG